MKAKFKLNSDQPSDSGLCSVKFVSIQVPEVIVSNITKKVSEYQVQRRSDPRYIDALHKAVALPLLFYKSNYCENYDGAIDSETASSYFANFDELIAVYQDQSALPKTLVNHLLTSFADAVLKNEGHEGASFGSSVQVFIHDFYERIGKLTGCNDVKGIRP